MKIAFDPDKDAAKITQHGLPLARAADLEGIVVVEDDRFAEPRFRLYGWIGDERYCAAVVERDDAIRVISLRRAHSKEFHRYA